MLYLPKSYATRSTERPIAKGAIFQAEGQVAVYKKGATHEGVMPSTGGADEIFAGITFTATRAETFPLTYFNKVEDHLVGGFGIVTLQRAPIAGQFLVIDLDTGDKVTTGELSGKEISKLTVGANVRVTYKHNVTPVEALAIAGSLQPGGPAHVILEQIGLVEDGLQFTSEFDASVDWSKVTAVKAAANGQIVGQDGTGIELPLVVAHVPSEEIPYLGLKFVNTK